MCASKKKKKRRKHNKRRNTTPQTKKTRPRTAGKQWYDNQVCYGPMHPTYHIHRYTCVDEKTKYVAKEGAQGTTPHAKKRTTNHHARQKACPQTQTTTIYPPYSSIGSDHREIHDEKKQQQKGKRYGAATENTDNGETMKRRTSMLKIRRRAPLEHTTHAYPNVRKTAK